MSLYSRLFRREGKTRLEDFLTEALVDLLEKLGRFDDGKGRVISFIEEVFLGEQVTDPALKKEIINRLENATTLYWKTQDGSAGSYGRPDIVLYDEHGPLLVVENKIRAAFTWKQIEEEEKGDEAENEKHLVEQLPAYDQWLSSLRDRKDPVALILLTHWTDPPKGFIGPSEDRMGQYSIPLRAVCRWHRARKWLDAYARAKGDTLGAVLAIDLANFLEGHGMSDQITISDLTAARMFLGSISRIHMMMEGLRNVAKRSTEGRSYVFLERVDGRVGRYAPWVVWDWFYRDKDQRWHVAWGVRFLGDEPDYFHAEWEPEHPLFWGRPRVEEVFVYVANDNPNASDELPAGLEVEYKDKGWAFATKKFCIKARPIYQILEEGDDLMGVLLPWFETTIREAVEILEKSSR